MSKTLPLAEMSQGTIYQVLGFESETSVYAQKLHKMGFVKGTPVSLAPVAMKDPIVVQIRGSRVALRKTEAKHVLVEGA
ncbi:FeoA family protein [Pseudodesulfovibrio sediminis]|uniref:Ferrous iron transporter FeoA-like domain-containing protein n=1 Tax=Pseudodesulfovibrio sediminis TaxID=2810563 RepID=A0ABN6EQR2_9BACT|nr:FeoA family protein [Pseudodesulfovibrio sediminis]BCS87772.1 hypothetical protein PSDVSF_10140 [Pseudodesulfovibrio sediminis]